MQAAKRGAYPRYVTLFAARQAGKRTSQAARLFSGNALLPDAELREDLAEHVLHVEPPSQPAQPIGSFTQMLGRKLGVIASLRAGKERMPRRRARARFPGDGVRV